ncbi:hypothetical protein PMKS-003207 [Pichia membranifaciens]|uniref:Uncharacterized protein n=1 Tax=Pichia membranifaciens TaxID=4926 RepID=A0A1Q2YJK5_9ASCO|nr:hypothetical protein PMKS-003207 [Pichia membranifaciens]
MYVHDEGRDAEHRHTHGHSNVEYNLEDAEEDDGEDRSSGTISLPPASQHRHRLAEDDSLEDITDTAVPDDKLLEKKDLFSSEDIEKQLTGSSSELDSVYAAQILNVFVLEFGIVFHSVFVGLTLSCSGDEFISLYIVVVFHQMFEGLGLGTRVACVEWPASKRWTPWLLCLAYTFCTPIAIAIGIGVRNSYPPGSRRALITNGVFDSVSAGILIYTGCIELMAHEFLFSDEFKGPGGFKKMIWAYIVMCVGAGLMALLGRWA